MPTAGSAVSEELELHYRAYRQIFQAVLKKKTADPAKIESVQNDLFDYLQKNVKTPDAFIDHIPEFARRMGVDPGSLGAFIGANFMKALAMAKQAPPPPPGTAAAPGSTVTGKTAGDVSATSLAAGGKDQGILKEIAQQFGQIVQAPDQFIPMDWGLVKFKSVRGELLPQSIGLFEAGLAAPPPPPGTGSSVGTAPATPGLSPAQSPGQSAAAGSPGSSPASAPRPAAKPAPVAAPPEPSIIKDILEKFGSVLDVHEKLVPNEIDEIETGSPASEGGAPAVGSAATAPTGNAAPVGTSVPAAPSSLPTKAGAAKVDSSTPRDSSIIKEILDRFGSTLDVHKKLEPSSGLAPGFEVGGGDDEDEDNEPSATADVERLPLDFVQYMDAVKSLQEFQKSGDQQKYRAWLMSLDSGPKAAVGIRNLEVRARKGGEIYWPDEYQNLSTHLGVQPDSVRLLHEDLRRFDQLQRILSKFTDAIRTLDAVTVNAARLVWPQIRLLFNEPGDESALLSRCKIIMLQVIDPARKQKIMGILEPLLKEAAVIL